MYLKALPKRRAFFLLKTIYCKILHYMEEEFKGVIPQMKKFFRFTGGELATIDIEAISNGVFCHYNAYLNKEYKEMAEKYPNLYFWESHLTLNHKLEEVKSVKELDVLKCENIYEEGKYIHTITHNFETNETTEEKKVDEWYNSRQFNPLEEVGLTLEEILDIYEKSELKTTGDKITLRSPFVSKALPVYYIIGQLDSPRFITIDAIKGEIGLIK